MAKTPKVGDPAMLDGIELTVFSVESDRIHFADDDAVKCRARVAEIRAAENESNRAETAAKLAAVPRGTRVGVHPADVVWMEDEQMVSGHDGKGFTFARVSAWSVPGRLSPDNVRGIKVPKDFRRQDAITMAHRASKAAAAAKGA